MISQSGRYVVIRALNDYDAMVVQDNMRNCTLQLVGFEHGGCEGVLEDAEAGDVFTLDLRRIRARGTAWWVEDATQVDERLAPIVGGVASTDNKLDR